MPTISSFWVSARMRRAPSGARIDLVIGTSGKDDKMSGSPAPEDFGLLTPAEVDELPPNSDADALKSMLRWVKDFVAQPHPERDPENPNDRAAVCPFMPGSLAKGLTWFTLPNEPVRSPEDVMRIVDAYRDVLKELPPTRGRDARFKTIIIVFPMVDASAAPAFIDDVHERVAGEYRSDALMLGEFHSRNQKHGSHNPNFFGLQSPVPAMALRLMVALDYLFLTKRTGDPLKDLENLLAYTKAMARMDPPPSKKIQEMIDFFWDDLKLILKRAMEVPPDAQEGPPE
ncbi:DUF6875 domain-containing protein [Streptomyces sp. NPDC005931]|uniref:DUF6875 domain-containing protein n=1 Tax=Streptomyces sp. NPDC005931 TaxID=3364737 RepID=UPI00368AEA2D